MKKILILGIVALMLQSCATVMSGRKQTITFNSEPSDATVYTLHCKKKKDFYTLDRTKAIAIGKTPMTVDLKKNTSLIFVSKEGYKDTTLFTHSKKYRFKFVDPKTGIVEARKIQLGKYYAHTNAWYFVNLLFSPTLVGLYMMNIDILTGSCYRLDKNMNVTLEKK